MTTTRTTTRSWRTRVLATTAAAAAAVALAACSSSSSGGGSKKADTTRGAGTGAVPEPTTPVSVSFASWVGTDPTMKKLAAQFHREHPNITIKFQNVPAEEASDKLTVQVANNTAPDVAYVDASSTSDFAARGALVNLDDYVKRSSIVKMDDYVPAFRTFVTWNGHTWGLPLDGESTGLFYRKDLFAAAGLSTPPTTWDEFEADAKALTDKSKKQYGFEMFASEAAYYWYPWLYQAGGDLLSTDGKKVLFTSDAAKQAAKFYVNLRKYSPPDYLNSNSYDGRVAFSQGKVGMYVAGAWFAGTLHSEFPKIDGKWAAAPLPSGSAGCKTTIAGDSLVMFSQSKHSDAAWKWIEFLSKPDNLALWTYKSANGTLLPPRASLLNSPDLIQAKPILKPFADLMKCGVASTVANPKFPQIEKSLNQELGKAIYGQQSSDDALNNAAAAAKHILKR